MGLVMYLWLSLVLMSQYHLNRRSREFQRNGWDILCSVLYTLTCTYHMLVPIVYWGLLSGSWSWYQSSVFDRWLNLSVHGFDAVVILFEFLFCNSIVYYWGHVVIMIVVIMLYLILAFLAPVLWAYTGRSYPYYFTDPAEAMSWAVIA